MYSNYGGYEIAITDRTTTDKKTADKDAVFCNVVESASWCCTAT